MIETMKVKPWGKDQGDHVVINKADFDPKRHELFEPKADGAAVKGKKKDEPKADGAAS